jgi:hypothetical protein
MSSGNQQQKLVADNHDVASTSGTLKSQTDVMPATK